LHNSCGYPQRRVGNTYCRRFDAGWQIAPSTAVFCQPSGSAVRLVYVRTDDVSNRTIGNYPQTFQRRNSYCDEKQLLQMWMLSQNYASNRARCRFNV
ncbi:uncharacterized protein METZ01_LOCUS420733, partial [marine metagenome]